MPPKIAFPSRQIVTAPKSRPRPIHNAQLDWTHPLTKGLEFFILYGNYAGITFKNLAKNKTVTQYTSLYLPANYQILPDFYKTNGTTGFGLNLGVTVNQSVFSCAFSFKPIVQSAGDAAGAIYGAFTNDQIRWMTNAPTSTYHVYDDAAWPVTPTTGQPTKEGFYRHCASINGADITSVLGVGAQASTTNIFGALRFPLTKLSIGGSSHVDLDGEVYAEYSAIWSRLLSESEKQEFNDNPYALLVDPLKRTISLPPAVPSQEKVKLHYFSPASKPVQQVVSRSYWQEPPSDLYSKNINKELKKYLQLPKAMEFNCVRVSSRWTAVNSPTFTHMPKIGPCYQFSGTTTSASRFDGDLSYWPYTEFASWTEYTFIADFALYKSTSSSYMFWVHDQFYASFTELGGTYYLNWSHRGASGTTEVFNYLCASTTSTQPNRLFLILTWKTGEKVSAFQGGFKYQYYFGNPVTGVYNGGTINDIKIGTTNLLNTTPNTGVSYLAFFPKAISDSLAAKWSRDPNLLYQSATYNKEMSVARTIDPAPTKQVFTPKIQHRNKLEKKQRLVEPLEIDWENPLTANLSFACVASRKYRTRNLITGDKAGLDQVYIDTDDGQFVMNCTSSQRNVIWYKEFIKTSTGDGSGDFTMAARANPVASGSSLQHVFVQKNDDAGNGYAQAGLYANSNASWVITSGRIAFVTYNGTVAGVSKTAAVNGQWHTYVGRRVSRGGSNVTLFITIDDITNQVISATTTRTIADGLRNTAIGCRGDSSVAEAMNDNVEFAMAWNRFLTNDEVDSFLRNPYQIFKTAAQIERTIILPPAYSPANRVLPV